MDREQDDLFDSLGERGRDSGDVARRKERGPWRGRLRLPASPLLLVLLFLGVAVLLIGWNRAASSPRLCASCHAMEPAVVSAERSLHSAVPCLGCHTRPGLLGSLRYIPTLAREGLATATGTHLDGILEAGSCERCHSNVTSRITGEASGQQHPGPGSRCLTCHGDVAHPAQADGVPDASAQPTIPHPPGWVQTHGAAATEGSASCASCHKQRFCGACHFRSTFPHPDNWIARHGAVQMERGPDACTLCHAPTFCAGCHGTEIPHQPTWLGEHARALEDTSTSTCYVCHATVDCTVCHAEHGAHREQDLYYDPAGGAL